MTSRAVEPDVRARLVEAAARVLGSDGPAGLSTRKLAAEVGTSTMAVYTHFGSLPGLVSAVAAEGFARLGAHLAAVPRTDDAQTDLANIAVAYRTNALENPHLYRVMFGSTSLGMYDRETPNSIGYETFEVLVAGVRRGMDEGVLRPDDADRVAAQLWSALHGYLMLELAGFLTEDDGSPDRVLWPMMTNLVTALGPTPA